MTHCSRSIRISFFRLIRLRRASVNRTYYRKLLLVELVLAYALPVVMLVYGIVVFAGLFVSALISVDPSFVPALLLLATYIGLGLFGLLGVLRLAMAEIRDTVLTDRPWKILAFCVAGLIGWVIVVGGPNQPGLGPIWLFLFWAPIAVGLQLLILNWKRLQRIHN